jgi:hypothetical protein
VSVYIDKLFTTRQTPRWPFSQSCHMIADSVEELHAFAATLGLRRAWFQRQPPHYDLTSGKRWEAMHRGAIEISRRELVTRLRASRAQHDIDTLPSPITTLPFNENS